MIRRIDLATTSPAQLAELVRRSAVPDQTVRAGAEAIVAEVRDGGDAAARNAAARFGGGLPDGSLRVPIARVTAARDALDETTRDALTAAARAIRTVHEPQRPRDHVVEPVVYPEFYAVDLMPDDVVGSTFTTRTPGCCRVTSTNKRRIRRAARAAEKSPLS